MRSDRRYWRDQASATLLEKFLEESNIEGHTILELLTSPESSDSFPYGSPKKVDRWSRATRSNQEVRHWPEKNQYDVVTLRLPKSKKELEMFSHLAFSRLNAGGPLWIYGANDEGIKSAENILRPLADSVTTVAYGSKCRVLEAKALQKFNYRGELADWETLTSIHLAGKKRDWVSYPGVFAQGCVDKGTQVLIDSLPSIPASTKVLDFGCGSGLVGGEIGLQDKLVLIDFLDIDVLALEAVKKNIPEATIIASDGYRALGDRRYDLIVSNPPYHKGKDWSEDVIKIMIEGGTQHLNLGGKLIFVVQRRLKMEGLLSAHFETVEVLADSDIYRVWCANL